jgi:hypothetical protein
MPNDYISGLPFPLERGWGRIKRIIKTNKK